MSALPVAACAQDSATDTSKMSQQNVQNAETGDGAVNYEGSVIKFTYKYDGPIYEKMSREFQDDFKELAIDKQLYSEEDKPALGLYRYDLNGDGIREVFVNFADEFLYCGNVGCHNFVVAVDGDKVTRLAHFENSQISVATSETNGVKDLMVYTNPVNPHDFDLATWDDETQSYKLQND